MWCLMYIIHSVNKKEFENVDSKIKWEDGGGINFSHIYGLLNKDAMIGVYNHIWNDERIWVPNDELKEYAKNEFKREI